MSFTSDEVTSENHCRITARVKKVGIHANPCLFYFLHASLCPGRAQRTTKQSSIAHFATFAKDGLFRLGIVTSSQLIVRRHTNAGSWRCDVISVYCSCTRKLVQRRSLLMNCNRGYRSNDDVLIFQTCGCGL